MQRILLRSGKSPFDVVTAEQVLQRDLIGTNSGNLLFSDAAHKILLTPDTEVTSNGLRTDPSAAKAAHINEHYDVFVVPLANAFRPSFHGSLDRLSQLVEQLRIPVVVLGVGAQAGPDCDTGALSRMRPSVTRFVRAVLERSASIGVRGEMTADYLKGLGFGEVEVIGCPSMFLYGASFPELPAFDARPELDGQSRIAVNVSRGSSKVGPIAEILAGTCRRYPNLGYFAQNLVDAELLFWGDTSEACGTVGPLPTLGSHPLLRGDRARVPIDPAAWIEELRGYDFSFGTRIHGNIAALLAGTPAVVLCHDSRTLELCRYFEIPYQMLGDLPADTDAAELHEKADFSGLLSNHRERFERFTSFLDAHGLRNTFAHGDGGAAFEARLAELPLPAPIRRWTGTDDGALRYRMGWLREQTQRGQASQRKELRAAQEKIDALRAENGELRRRMAAVEEQLAALQGESTTRPAPRDRLAEGLRTALRRRP